MTESFLEETIISVNFGDEEGGNTSEVLRRDAVPKGDGQTGSTLQTKRMQEGECSEGFIECQQKRKSLFPRIGLSEQVYSGENATLFVTKQVNVACALLQNSLVNLVEVVETSSAICARSKPVKPIFVEKNIRPNQQSEEDPLQD